MAIRTVATLRDEIADEVAAPYVTDLMVGPSFRGFAADLAKRLAPRGIETKVVLASCQLLSGKEMTDETRRNFAWRIAGNLASLRAGLPLRALPVLRKPEWHPVQVLKTTPAKNRAGVIGDVFTLRIIAGTHCPITIVKFWRYSAVSVLSQSVGFTPRWGKMPYSSPGQLVGLRLFVLLDPANTRDGRPGFRHIAASSSMVVANRRVLKLRFRVGACCPQGYDGAKFVDCHRCGLGYRNTGDGACIAATHPRIYESRLCTRCGKTAAIFDVDVSAVTCLACFTAEQRGG